MGLRTVRPRLKMVFTARKFRFSSFIENSSSKRDDLHRRSSRLNLRPSLSLWTTFQSYTIKSKRMGADELEHFCYDHGYHLFPSEVRGALARVSPAGAMTFRVFQKWWQSPDRLVRLGVDVEGMKRRHALIELWQEVDTNDQGVIEEDDFVDFYEKLWKSIPDLRPRSNSEAAQSVCSARTTLLVNAVVRFLVREGHIQN